jgi:single-stranded-DNA-specific exonuclease
MLVPEDFVPVLAYDSEVALADVDQKLWEALSQLEPFGVGNSRPTFVVRGVTLVHPPRIMKEIHLKLRCRGSSQRPRDVVGWRMAAQSQREALLLGDMLDLAFTVDFSTHPDFGGVQMTLADFNRSGRQPT